MGTFIVCLFIFIVGGYFIDRSSTSLIRHKIKESKRKTEQWAEYQKNNKWNPLTFDEVVRQGMEYYENNKTKENK